MLHLEIEQLRELPAFVKQLDCEVSKKISQMGLKGNVAKRRISKIIADVENHCTELIHDLHENGQVETALEVYTEVLRPLGKFPAYSARRLLIANLPFELCSKIVEELFPAFPDLGIPVLKSFLLNFLRESKNQSLKGSSDALPLIQKIYRSSKAYYKSPVIRELMVRVYSALSESDAALSVVNGATDLPDSTYVHLTVALLRNSRIDEAEKIMESRLKSDSQFSEKLKIVRKIVSYHIRHQDTERAAKCIDIIESLALMERRYKAQILAEIDVCSSLMIRPSATRTMKVDGSLYWYSKIRNPDWKANWVTLQAFSICNSHRQGVEWALKKFDSVPARAAAFGYFGYLTLSRCYARSGWLSFPAILNEFSLAGFELLPRDHDELKLDYLVLTRNYDEMMNLWKSLYGKPGKHFQPSQSRKWEGNDALNEEYSEFGSQFGYRDFGVGEVFLSVIIDNLGFSGRLSDLDLIWSCVQTDGYPLNPNHYTSYHEALIRMGCYAEFLSSLEFMDKIFFSPKMVRNCASMLRRCISRCARKEEDLNTEDNRLTPKETLHHMKKIVPEEFHRNM
ncbi:MAG: hypothetical protein SGCHY_002201 [Lobulomycetales sp.]